MQVLIRLHNLIETHSAYGFFRAFSAACREERD